MTQKDEEESCSSSVWSHEDEEESSTFLHSHTTTAAAAALLHNNNNNNNHNRSASDSQQTESTISFSSPEGILTDLHNKSVPADEERQILLLMLLAQVCALHDPTPQTFTVHVLELFERNILDRQSIHFLHDLHLVPSTILTPPLPTSAATNSLNTWTHDDETIHDADKNPQQQPQQQLTTLHHHFPHRSAEVAAIRHTLEQSEKQRMFHKSYSEPIPSTTTKTSFLAKHYPLSLSRYQREFVQIKLLSSGSFGQVFQAKNKMDGREYAVKKVLFQASGFSRESVRQVMRETQCLAACDHPNVVRYHTSWLEPSWMTGTSGSAATTTATNITNSLDHTKLLLTDMQKLVESSGKDSLDGEDLSDDFKSYFKLTDLPIRTNRKSVEAGKQAVNVEEESIWTVEFEHSREESEYSSWSKHPAVEEPKSRATSSPEKTYQYQICMFIQMQLCEPFTLADWIRDRRKLQAPPKTVADRIDAVAAIFNQLVLGLAHVHEKGIIHRDLKPANVFVTRFGKECQFKIGDFGLSKLIPRSPIKSDQGATTTRTREMAPQQLAYGPDTAKMEDESEGAPPKSSTAWRDPLTAGVGTASYAAAEQVASRDYGTEADIFSLGLILLETLCGFSTEHERMLTFHDCRHRRTLPDALESFTVVKQTILACTDPDPKKRPRAADLVGIDLRQDVDMRTEQPSVETAAGVDGFRQQIKHRDDTIARLKAELEAKDDIINKLHEELGSLKQNGHPSTRGKIALVIPRARDDSPDFESESCSSTSSDNEL